MLESPGVPSDISAQAACPARGAFLSNGHMQAFFRAHIDKSAQAAGHSSQVSFDQAPTQFDPANCRRPGNSERYTT